MTGLLSNLCCRDEAGGETVYRGSRGNRANIFPGSVLFRKGPRWLMAAELVQTTRLYARTCAKIETPWVEELAAHVMTLTVSDPHFDKELGDAAAWERATLAGAVIVPRRRVRLCKHDPAASRELFIRHALVRGEVRGEYPFRTRNALVLRDASDAVAKLRSIDVMRDESDVIRWFDSRLPPAVVGRESFDHYLASLGPDQSRLQLSPNDLIRPERAAQLAGGDYPDSEQLGGTPAKIEYSFSPGKADDGVTLVVPLLSLDLVPTSRPDWLVPGMLGDVIAALVKALPKGTRAKLETAAGTDPATIGQACAQVLTFGEGPLAAALSEAITVLYACDIESVEWKLSALPDYLRLRFEIVDHGGRSIATGRDLLELKQRLAAKLVKAKAAAARAHYRVEGLTAWTFGELAEKIEADAGGEDLASRNEAYPTLIDRGESVSLTLLDNADQARVNTYFGIRRLFTLACGEELSARVRALPEWSEMVRHFSSLGSPDELADALACLTCERVFLFNQSAIRTRDAFEARRDEQWGRLGAATIEVGSVVARILESRFKVAGRFAGGTPRLWAASVADMREQAAYLMPKGFLKLVVWDHLRDYPRYVEGLRERLFRLREDGSGVESKSLQELSSRWKRFTGWIAQAMSKEKAALEHIGTGHVEESDRALIAGGGNKGKSALPPARRAAPTVNSDAGEWSMRPGIMPGIVEQYRWLLEDFRIGLFVPDMGGSTVSASRIDQAWAAVVKAAEQAQEGGPKPRR